MAVKIRLARRGRKKKPFYHIVIADARAPRDGKFIEKIGSYNPMTSPATIDVDRDKAYQWLLNGAQPTNTVRAILRFKGVLYKKHLQRGVKKGALTQEQADDMLAKWIEAKEAKITARIEQSAKDKADFYKKVSGEAKAVAVEAATEEDQEAFRVAEGSDEAPVEEAAAETTEAAPIAEAVEEVVSEETPEAAAEETTSEEE